MDIGGRSISLIEDRGDQTEESFLRIMPDWLGMEFPFSDSRLRHGIEESRRQASASENRVGNEALKHLRLDRQKDGQPRIGYVEGFPSDSVHFERIAGIPFEVDVDVDALRVKAGDDVHHAAFRGDDGDAPALLAHLRRDGFARHVVERQGEAAQLLERGDFLDDGVIVLLGGFAFLQILNELALLRKEP